MIIRQEIFDAYWKFAATRQEVFFSRIKNIQLPWTKDPIINNFKFCNVYRASDRVSQYLIKHVIYDGIQKEEEVIFRVILFRMFNKIETWQYLEEKIGSIELKNFDLTTFGDILENALNLGQTIYSNAYILCANKAFGYDRKHLNQLALVEKMIQIDKIPLEITKAPNLETIFHTLISYPLIGNFMGYQLAIDINYSEVVNFSENDFTIAGPGAERGIRKCFIDTEALSNADVIRWITEKSRS